MGYQRHGYSLYYKNRICEQILFRHNQRKRIFLSRANPNCNTAHSIAFHSDGM